MSVPVGIRDIFRLVDEVPTGLLVLDAEGGVLRANQLAASRIGRAPLDLLGLDFFREVLPQLEEDGQGVNYRQAVAAGHCSFTADATIVPEGGDRRVHLAFRSFEHQNCLWGLVALDDRSGEAREEVRRRRTERLAAVG
jgi:PAS domain-containing protein